LFCRMKFTKIIGTMKGHNTQYSSSTKAVACP
jgi:hypothetical protein